jgi:nitrilase
MRHIAIEAGAFVISVPQYIPKSAFPDDFPLELPEGVDVFGRGGACIVAPDGGVIAGPLYDTEGIVTADCDLRTALHAKRYFDVSGHYGRADVLGGYAR